MNNFNCKFIKTEIVDSAYPNKYEDFHLNEIKELKSFDVVNYIVGLILLNDGRILINESFDCDSDKNDSVFLLNSG